MSRAIVVSAAITSLLFILPIPTHAAPIIIRDSAFVDNRPADDIFGVTGLKLTIDVRATDSGGSGALTGTGSSEIAVSSNPSFPFSQPVNLGLNAVFPLINGAEFTRFLTLNSSQFSYVTGSYTYTVTNTSSQSTSITGHNLDKLEVIPLPTNLAFSDLTTTPVFTFTDPDPTPDLTGLVRRYQMQIFDGITKTNLFDSDLVSTPSFTVPSGILEAGMSYYFRASSYDIDTTETGDSVNSRSENRGMQYAIYTPVPEPSTLLLLGSGLAGLVGYGRRRMKK